MIRAIKALPSVLRVRMEWRHTLPWLAVAVAFALLVWGAERTGAAYVLDFRNIGTASDDVNSAELGVSSNFRLRGPAGYLSEGEAKQFLWTAEAERTRLMPFLGISEKETPVTVSVHPQDGISSGRPGRIHLFGFKAFDHVPIFVHELTHVLKPGYSSSFVREGLAEAAAYRTAQQCFCTLRRGVLYSLLRPAESFLWGQTGGERGVIPLTTLNGRGFLLDDFTSFSTLSYQRYLQAGSFTEYLIDTYGMDKVLEVYDDRNVDRNFGKSNFAAAYGRPLEELEDDWLASLRRGHLLLGMLVTFAGLPVLGLAHMAMSRTRSWIPSGVVGVLAFIVWSFYFGYMALMPAFLVATITAGVVSRWRRALGLRILWVAGLGSLAFLVLGPAIVDFF